MSAEVDRVIKKTKHSEGLFLGRDVTDVEPYLSVPDVGPGHLIYGLKALRERMKELSEIRLK